MSYGKSMPAYVTHNPYIILYIPDFALYTLILYASYHEYIRIKHTATGTLYGIDTDYPTLRFHRVQLPRCPRVSVGGQSHHFRILLLPRSKRRRY